jgi:hypothetical protein
MVCIQNRAWLTDMIGIDRIVARSHGISHDAVCPLQFGLFNEASMTTFST